MTSWAAIAVKTAGAAGAAAILSLGLAGGLAQAASPTPRPAPAAGQTQPATDSRADRRAVLRAVLESEAGVLGITPTALRHDLRSGQKVSDLAKAKGMTEEQFETRLIAAVRPRLEALVDRKVITQAQADRAVDRISRGHIPFWNGIHRK